MLAGNLIVLVCISILIVLLALCTQMREISTKLKSCCKNQEKQGTQLPLNQVPSDLPESVYNLEDGANQSPEQAEAGVSGVQIIVQSEGTQREEINNRSRNIRPAAIDIECEVSCRPKTTPMNTRQRRRTARLLEERIPLATSESFNDQTAEGADHMRRTRRARNIPEYTVVEVYEEDLVSGNIGDGTRRAEPRNTRSTGIDIECELSCRVKSTATNSHLRRRTARLLQERIALATSESLNDDMREWRGARNIPEYTAAEVHRENEDNNLEQRQGDMKIDEVQESGINSPPELPRNIQNADTSLLGQTEGLSGSFVRTRRVNDPEDAIADVTGASWPLEEAENSPSNQKMAQRNYAQPAAIGGWTEEGERSMNERFGGARVIDVDIPDTQDTSDTQEDLKYLFAHMDGLSDEEYLKSFSRPRANSPERAIIDDEDGAQEPVEEAAANVPMDRNECTQEMRIMRWIEEGERSRNTRSCESYEIDVDNPSGLSETTSVKARQQRKTARRLEAAIPLAMSGSSSDGIAEDTINILNERSATRILENAVAKIYRENTKDEKINTERKEVTHRPEVDTNTDEDTGEESGTSYLPKSLSDSQDVDTSNTPEDLMYWYGLSEPQGVLSFISTRGNDPESFIAEGAVANWPLGQATDVPPDQTMGQNVCTRETRIMRWMEEGERSRNTRSSDPYEIDVDEPRYPPGSNEQDVDSSDLEQEELAALLAQVESFIGAQDVNRPERTEGNSLLAEEEDQYDEQDVKNP